MMICKMGVFQWRLAVVLLLIVQLAHLAPLDPKPAQEGGEEEGKEQTENNGQQGDGLELLGLEYEDYLKEVIQVLEADPEMKAKMDEMTTDDLLSGKFGKQLHNVGNHIRGQLDELKRKEIQRLRLIARKKMEKNAAQNAGVPDQKFLDNLIGHIDPSTIDSFSPDDITKLIQKATKDLDENDKQRRKEFKRYEMEKELMRRTEMRSMDDKEREAAEKEYREEREQTKHHSKINHPGSKKQLEEVWEKTDHLDRDDFDPKTFFYLHDSNSDGFLDEFELEALFIKEVEKSYQGQKNVDPQEKFEELSRMREHVVDQIDSNQDKMVSLEEFMDAAAAPEFDEDSAWEDINQEDQFTENDLKAYQNELRKTLEDTKAKMAEAGDNFVRVRQPQRQQPVAMDQGHAQQIKNDLEAGLPPLGGHDDKLRFNGNIVPQQPNIQVQEPVVNQVNQQEQQQQEAGAPANPPGIPPQPPQQPQAANPPNVETPQAPGGPPQ